MIKRRDISPPQDGRRIGYSKPVLKPGWEKYIEVNEADNPIDRETGRVITGDLGMHVFRCEYIYPKLTDRYGATAVKGARLFFANPRNMEHMIVAITTGERESPMCDEWDASGVVHEPEEMEL
jgi:hypothetical protein